MPSCQMETTVLYYNLACKHCVTFIKLLDGLPEISKRVHRVQVGRNAPHNLLMVPAIVIGNSRPLYGEQAFEWLKRESQTSVKPFALGDQASPTAGIHYTFLDDEAASVGVEAPPANSLDALVAQRNAEIARPIARA
jgi:hypothetical protein